MSILQFFKSNIGTWKTLRTVYDPTGSKLYADKSTVNIQIDKELLDDSKDLDKKYRLMIQNIISSTAKILSNQSGKNQIILQNCETNTIYSCNDLFWHCNTPDHLSVYYQCADLHIQEQIWLVNSNLRLSISTIQKHNRCLCVSFNSDIKITQQI
uniref:Uncharacterized protein n=1 Tax=Scinaia undulata TaxID=1884664 RepID=A0A1G4NXK6_9FLOR|nr:Hypothetical protein ycf58 [Scinaia undulata]SCW23375.1 Hypothetical protein ycf58 [Scinaia undulata]